MSRWGIGLILVVCGAAFGVVWSYQFLNWDDNYLLLNNPWVQAHSAGDLLRVWDPRPALQTQVPEFFPLRDLCYALLHWLWGLSPWVYHGLNWLLYLLHIWLVFWLAKRLLQDLHSALFAALCFGLHPLHVEVVAWVSGLKELLMATFLWVGLACFLRFAGEGRPAPGAQRFAIVAVLCAVLAGLSKHVGIIAVGFYGLYLVLYLPRASEPLTEDSEDSEDSEGNRGFESSDASEPSESSEGSASTEEAEPGRPHWLKLWWPVLASGVFALFWGLFSLEVGKSTLGIHQAFVPVKDPASPWLLQPMIQMQNALRLFFPWKLQPMYTPPDLSQGLGLLWWLSALACLAFVGWLAWAAARGKRLLLFLAGWMVLGVAPFAVVRVGEQFTADRYLYVSSAAFCMLLGLGYARLRRRSPAWGRWLPAAFVLWMAYFGVVLWDTLPMWRDQKSFWTIYIQRAPTQTHALAGWARYQMGQGNAKAGVKAFRTYLKHHPRKMGPHLEADMCVALLQAGESKAAVKRIRRLLRKAPHDAFVLNAAGFILARGGQYQTALRYFRAAIGKKPQLYQAHLNYVRALWAAGQKRQAKAYASLLLRRPLPGSVRQELLRWVRK